MKCSFWDVHEKRYTADEIAARFLRMKDNLILQRPRGNNQGGEFTEKAPTLTSNHWEQNNLLMKRINQLNISDESNGRQPYQQNRVFDIDGISPALMNGHAGQTINVLIKNKRIKDNLRRTDDKSLTLRATSYKGAESNGMTLVKMASIASGVLHRPNVQGCKPFLTGINGNVVKRSNTKCLVMAGL